MIFYTIILLIFLLYLYARYQITYWKRKHVKEVDPIPFFGDSFGMFFGGEPIFDMVLRLYNKHPTARYVGTYATGTRSLLIRDPDLIKQLGVKDFDNFMDHRAFVPDDLDPYWSHNLFGLRGSKWKEMRGTVSPTFTATKMRAMFVLMNETAQQFITYLTKRNEREVILEVKDAFSRYANDVIANCAFGVGCDSLANRNNDFYLNGKETVDFTDPIKSIKMFTFFLFPKIATLFNFTLFSKQIGEFFLNLIKDTIKLREEQNIIRPDLIHLLMEARKGNLKYEESSNEQDAGFAAAQESYIGKTHKVRQHELSDLDIAAQALIFFFAGFDTVSTAMSFVFYELALNSDVQERLRNEIDHVRNLSDGELTYNHIAGMKYLDMVLSESLRKWPPVTGTERECIKDYTIEAVRADEKTFNIESGDIIGFPIVGLHYDPKYYPDPQKFDPERFSDENKRNINPYTYLPFGVGPRNCIGSRFALLEVKTLLFHVLSEFEVLPCAETPIPVKINKKHFNLLMDGDCKLLFRKRV